MGELLRAVCHCGLEDICLVGRGERGVSYSPHSCPRCGNPTLRFQSAGLWD